MRATILLTLLLTTFASAQPPGFEGLWRAKRVFEIEVQGTLTIEREGDAWRADIGGRTAAVRADKNRLTFDLGEAGSFRGELQGERIAGHWTQPYSVSGGYPFATPVTLTPVTLKNERANRWRGTVTPLPDAMTMFLPITRDADGTLRTFLRNPERNVGIFVGPARLAVDGNNLQLFGKRRPEAPERMMAGGRYDAESDLLSLDIPSRGGTYDFERFTPPASTPWSYRKPSLENDGWPVAGAEEVGLDTKVLAPFLTSLREPPLSSLYAQDIHALLIARNGKLVVEEYFRGAHREQLHDTRSAAKSLTAILAGAAKVPVSTKVYAAFDRREADPRAQKLTLEHLLTMSSGFNCDDSDDNSPGHEDRMSEQSEQPDWYRFTLDLGFIREPGEKSVYCSVQPHLAGGVITRVTGKPLPELFRETVAEPLQIRHYALNMTPTGDAYMGGGVRVTARDFLKFAQLMLDDGKWRGKQILSPEFVRQSVEPHYPLGSLRYGYLWWIIDLPYKGKTVRAFYAGGNGGQTSMAIPELDLAIVVFGGNYGDNPRTLGVQRELVPKQILPAIP
ncbi:MAG TPA: serine hydrolase [Thermoanaerobaculia bacterium]|jgi:CubicO group peptidase (beta-lactamase class C family)